MKKTGFKYIGCSTQKQAGHIPFRNVSLGRNHVPTSQTGIPQGCILNRMQGEREKAIFSTERCISARCGKYNHITHTIYIIVLLLFLLGGFCGKMYCQQQYPYVINIKNFKMDIAMEDGESYTIAVRLMF
jgi:hypothetical protein